MKKLLGLLFTMLFSFTMFGCDKEEDEILQDLRLIDGVWEVTYDGDQDVFLRGCCLDISTAPQANFGSLRGNITTFYLTATDNKLYDKAYSWSIREIEKHQALIDVVFMGDLDSNDLKEGYYNYEIVKLNGTHMWWQVNTGIDNVIIMFKRRTDISLE